MPTFTTTKFITPEQFLNNCSDAELAEVNNLMAQRRFRERLNPKGIFPTIVHKDPRQLEIPSG
jgi:hypothetical protein